MEVEVEVEVLLLPEVEVEVEVEVLPEVEVEVLPEAEVEVLMLLFSVFFGLLLFPGLAELHLGLEAEQHCVENFYPPVLLLPLLQVRLPLSTRPKLCRLTNP